MKYVLCNTDTEIKTLTSSEKSVYTTYVTYSTFLSNKPIWIIPKWKPEMKILLILISINYVYGAIKIVCILDWNVWDEEKHTSFFRHLLVQLDLGFQNLQSEVWRHDCYLMKCCSGFTNFSKTVDPIISEFGMQSLLETQD